MNLFELFVKVGVDDQASGKLENLSKKLGNGLKTAAKIGTAAVAAATTAVIALTTAAVNSCAEYEQLIGGVEAAFGDNQIAINKVIGTSKNAWKDLTLSQNQYYQSFMGAYPLIKASIEDENEAIETTNRLLTLEADLANTFGYDMENAANAINWALKGTYSYLDNLNIGISGTAEGFLEAANNSGLFNKTIENLDELTSADKLAVIEFYADQYGVLGRTASEAAETITGSLSMVSAAWDNVLTSLAAGEDADISLEDSINSLVESVTLAAGNILPAITQAVSGVGTLVSNLAPVIAEELPLIIQDAFPKLLTAAQSVLQSLIQNLPSLLSSLFPEVLSAVSGIVSMLLEELPGLIDSILNWIGNDGIKMIRETVSELAPEILPAVISIVESLVQNLPSIFQALIDEIPKLTESVNSTIKENFPALLSAVIDLVLLLIQHGPELIQMLVDQIEPIVSTIVSVIVQNAPAFIMGVAQIIVELIKSLPSLMVSFADTVLNIFRGIGRGLVDAWPAFREGMLKIWDKISLFWAGLREKIKSIGSNIIDGIKQGIQEKWANLEQWFRNLFGDLIGVAKRILGIASPSKVFKKLGGWAAEGFGIGFNDVFSNVEGDIENALDFGNVDYEIETATTSIGSFGNDFGLSSGSGLSIVQNIYSEAKTAADLMQEALYQQEKVVWLGV